MKIRHMIALIMLVLFITSGMVMAEEKKDDQKEKASSEETVKSTEKSSVIDKTLDKVPAIKEDASKEEIKTRPAAVTRAAKSTKTELPLIWKLEKSTPSDDSASPTLSTDTE